MIWLFSSLTILFSMIFFLVWNPLTLGLILIIQTLILSVLLGTMTTFWFMYLLILVFIGGMLVLFIYVSSIFPNEKFSFSQTTSYIILASFFILLITLFIFYNHFMLNFNLNTLESTLNMMTNSYMVNTNKIFNTKNSLILIFLVNYLFYCMVIVIKMTNFFKGPLRMMNYV